MASTHAHATNAGVKLTNVKDCIKRGLVKEGEDPQRVAADQLMRDEVEVLHTIGGDDTNTAAADLSAFLGKEGYPLCVIGERSTAQKQRPGPWHGREGVWRLCLLSCRPFHRPRPLPLAGLPKTIDNDVFPIQQSLGAWTAAEQGARFFENVVAESSANPRMMIVHEVMGRDCGWLTAATAQAYRKRLSKRMLLPAIGLSMDRLDVHAVYVPEVAIDLEAEAARLREILDKHDCVNIFISEGAGVKDIVAKMEAEGKNVPRDAFGHVKLDAINPGKARPPSPRQRAQAVRI